MVQQQNAPKFDENSDLYAQISASDQADAPKKQRDSLIMSIMVSYMRMTLRLDEQKRKYAGLFRLMSYIWMGMMSCLYLCGVVMFCILIGSYFRFPTEVEKYLANNGILYDKKEIPGYIFSQVNLYGLHDKNKTYQIDKVVLVSTFADFLNKRAKNLSLSGVRLNIATEAKKGEDILSKIAALNNKASTGVGVRIDSLSISDANLVIKGKNYEVPVSVSLTGMYGQETNISAYVKVAEPYLSMEGPLTIRKQRDQTKWNFTFADGRINLPNQPSEKISGSIDLETNRGKVLSLKSDIRMLYEKLQKSVAINLTNTKENFDGDLVLKWTDKSNAEKPVDRTTISFGLSQLKIDSAGNVQTENPIQVDISSKYSSSVQMKGLSTSMTGKLVCKLFDNCVYDLRENSPVSVEEMQLPLQKDYIKNERPVKFNLTPQEKMLELAFKAGNIRVNAGLERLVFKGKGVDSADKVDLTVDRISIEGQSNLWQKLMEMNLRADNIAYKTPSQEFTQGKIAIQNMFERNETVTVESPRVVLKNNSYLKEPFSIKYTIYQNKTRADVALENRQARLLFEGKLDLTGGIVDGLLVIPPVKLEKLKQPLNRISDLIPAGLKKATGEVTGYGYLSGNTRSGILGPFYLALSDVDVETEQLTVNRINTALTISSLVPLISETNQPVYIGEVDSFFPITDITFNMQLGDKFAQVSALKAMMMGIPLVSESVLIPYRTIPTIIYFKNKDYDLSGILKGIVMKDWEISGRTQGNILFPLEVKDFIVKLKNASVQIMNMNMKYKGNKQPAFMDKDKSVSVRSGTVVIDEGDDNELQANIAMDVVLQPSGVKKTVRETYSGNLGELVTIKQEKENAAPENIMKNVHEIQNKVNGFLNKSGVK